MIKKDAKERIEKLKEFINEYRYSRHVLDKELVSIEIEDSLKKELFDLEQEFSEFITPDSPTQRVGGKPLKEFKKVKHSTRMLSFNDAFSIDDLKNWETRNEKLYDGPVSAEYFCELKIDGLAIKLVYENGILITAATRGDGSVGEDVTQNIKTIDAIPLRLQTTKISAPKILEVRGEVFINKSDFEKLNQERKKSNESAFANPRNAAAGSIRQLDSKITAKRKLDSFIYNLATDCGQKTHKEEHIILKKLGFKTNPNVKLCKNLEEVREFRDYWEKNRDKLLFEIDGVVVQINNNEDIEKLGVVGKAPRGAIAFKFAPKEATTIIENIKIQIGRTGTLTPVAVLKPIKIGGVTISRASLHNEDEIKRLNLKIGDTVAVGRAGDVIPQISKVFIELRTGKEREFKFPKNCPICKSSVLKTGARYKCLNKNCFALQKEKIYHFVSKSALDIVGLGPQLIDKLIENGLVQDVADLFLLKVGDLSGIEGLGDLSEKNLITSVAKKKKIILRRFIYALGILHIGEENAKILNDFFQTRTDANRISVPSDLWGIGNSVSKEKYDEIFGFGPQIVKSVCEWFQDKTNEELLKKLDNSGIKIEIEHIKVSIITGKTFCFTGELEKMPREKAQELVSSMGGISKDTITKDLEYLVVGENPGSKLEKAKRLGVKIINEQEFWVLIER